MRTISTLEDYERQHHVENLQQQIDEQLVELANLRDQLSQEKILNQNQETYLNLLEKEVEDLIKTLKGQHGDNR